VVPDGVEVRKRFADLFRGEVAAVLAHALRLRENPKEHLLATKKEKNSSIRKNYLKKNCGGVSLW
jgi:hypothetical protein